MSIKQIILWDIDGTLLDTQGAGVGPLCDSVAGVIGKRPVLNRKEHAGKSDYEIIESISGISTSDDSTKPVFEKILGNYVQGLGNNLRETPARVLGDTFKTLSLLQESPNVRLGLLSGNCKEGGREKLLSANLLNFFEPEICFFASFEQSHRVEILESALVGLSNIVIVGDTPNDVQAAKEHKVPIISVATGLYNSNELNEINNKFVLRQEWKSWEFIQLLEKLEPIT